MDYIKKIINGYQKIQDLQEVNMYLNIKGNINNLYALGTFKTYYKTIALQNHGIEASHYIY